MSTAIRRRVANKRNSRKLVHRRVKQTSMRLEGVALTPTEC